MSAREVIAEALWVHDGVHPPSPASCVLSDRVAAALRADPAAVLALLPAELLADIEYCARRSRWISDGPCDRLLAALARVQP